MARMLSGALSVPGRGTVLAPVLCLLLAAGTVYGLQEETVQVHVVTFADWDVDDDDLLSEEEWRLGVFGLWDVDADGVIAEDEWRVVFVEREDFDTWDIDTDGWLTVEEFEVSFDWDGIGD